MMSEQEEIIQNEPIEQVEQSNQNEQIEIPDENDEGLKLKYKVNYVNFCISQLISQLGTSIFNFALSLYILDLTGSATLFATMLSLTLIPAIIINAFGGVLIDRMNKKKVFVMCDFLSGILLVIFSMALKLLNSNLIIFGIVIVILSIFQNTFSLALSAAIPNLTNKKGVVKLNAASQGIFGLIRICGPMTGALLYSRFNINTVILLDGCSFIISGIMEIFLYYNQQINTESQGEKKKYKESIKEVYKYINNQPGYKTLIGVNGLSSLIFGSLTSVVLPYITYTELQLSSMQVSKILSSAYAGMVIGTVVISIINKSNNLFKKMLLFFNLELIIGITWVFPLVFKSLQVSQVTLIFCIIMFLVGIVVCLVTIPALGYVQTTTGEELRASILGVINMLSQIANLIGMSIYGVLLGAINWGYVVVIPSAILIVVISIISRSKSLRAFFASID